MDTLVIYIAATVLAIVALAISVRTAFITQRALDEVQRKYDALRSRISEGSNQTCDDNS